MGWGGVDLIPVRTGETPDDAIERVYEGGVVFAFTRDGMESWDLPKTTSRPLEAVSRDERSWMLEAIGLCEALVGPLKVFEEQRGEKRRWPHRIGLLATAVPMQIALARDHLNLKLPNRPHNEEDWCTWWPSLT